MNALININTNATIRLTGETKAEMFNAAVEAGFDASKTSFINLTNGKVTVAKGWTLGELPNEECLEAFRKNAKSFSTTTAKGRVMVVSNSKGLRVKFLANAANQINVADIAKEVGGRVKGVYIRFGIMSEAAINNLVDRLNKEA